MIRSIFLITLSVLASIGHGKAPPIQSINKLSWGAENGRQVALLSPEQEVAAQEVFSFALWIRLSGEGEGHPSLATNKLWDGSEIVDLLSTSNMGITLKGGVDRGWALAVQPNGSWAWNTGNGKSRLDYLPTVARQPILDDRWHLLAFSIDETLNEARLYYDGVNVAIYSINGFTGLSDGLRATVGGDRVNNPPDTPVSGTLANARLWNRKLSDEEVFSIYCERYPNARQGASAEHVEEIKVLSWNIWHGARHPGTKKGIQQAVDIIRSTEADVITMQETYGSGPAIADQLGYYFYLRSSNLSILSRYPIEDTHDLYQPFRLGGASLRLSPSQQLNVFSLWIHYLPAWRSDAYQSTATAEALVDGEWKTRAKEIQEILKELQPFIENSDKVPLIVGGDFNSPSILDWTESTESWHNGLAVEWPVSEQMLEQGFVDSYRYIHSNPLEHAAHEKWNGDAKKLTHRIDYIYSQGESIKTLSSQMMNDHNGEWPSDHPAVLTTYRMPTKPMRVITYNVLEGFRGERGEERRKRVAAWLRKQEPAVVAFQELNGYSQERLQREASLWSHKYAETLKEDGYIVGLTSRSPIEVVERLRQRMHHGMLHCRTGGIDYLVIHLSPFRFKHRQKEAELIIERVKKVRAENRPVVVLGDFNAYSPSDRHLHTKNLELLHRLAASDARHDHVENLDRGKIDYSVMQSLLQIGLVDAYERNETVGETTKPRIDFILVSPDLAERNSAARWFTTKAHEEMSDHFPVSADFRLPAISSKQ
ncbi:MAG TPA: hypothetical protein DDW52_28725 [Planctomycetaceae bacterium]|nr:hypothetical protein [Planctomycetaceae bacterium]